MLYKNMELHNITNLTHDSEGRLVMSRIPEHVQQKMITKEIAFQCSGVEVRFKMIDDEVTFVIEGIHDDVNLITVMNGSFKSNLKPFFSKGLNEIVITKPANLERLKLISDEMNLPYDPEMVRVLLSATNYSPPEIIGEIESPESLKHPEKTYLAYGSSITSGGSANLQEFNYPALLARKLGAERLSFGFSGSAKLEKEMADYIASLKGIDYITMELGVNLSWDVANNCWGDPVKFRELVEYFVPTIAEAHKDIPIILSLIHI